MYTDAVRRRIRSGLTIFGFFTAAGLLLFGYRYLEYVANRETVSPWDPFINEVASGAWTGVLLFPFLARFARRYPMKGASKSCRLLQPGVFRLGLLKDRDIGVGVFPESEEILVGSLGFGLISRQSERSA